MSDTHNAQLIAWLEDQGHASEEIEQILAKVAEYDARTAHESVFDSIQAGTLDLAAIIKEALGDADGA